MSTIAAPCVYHYDPRMWGTPSRHTERVPSDFDARASDEPVLSLLEGNERALALIHAMEAEGGDSSECLYEYEGFLWLLTSYGEPAVLPTGRRGGLYWTCLCPITSAQVEYHGVRAISDDWGVEDGCRGDEIGFFYAENPSKGYSFEEWEEEHEKRIFTDELAELHEHSMGTCPQGCCPYYDDTMPTRAEYYSGEYGFKIASSDGSDDFY